MRFQCRSFGVDFTKPFYKVWLIPCARLDHPQKTQRLHSTDLEQHLTPPELTKTGFLNFLRRPLLLFIVSTALYMDVKTRNYSVPYIFTSFLLFLNINFSFGDPPGWCRGWNCCTAIAQRSTCAVAKSSITVETQLERGPSDRNGSEKFLSPYIQGTPVVGVYLMWLWFFFVTLVGSWPVMHVG